jgi:hypothetical protein
LIFSYCFVMGFSAAFANTQKAAMGVAAIPFLFIFYGFYDIAWTPVSLFSVRPVLSADRPASLRVHHRNHAVPSTDQGGSHFRRGAKLGCVFVADCPRRLTLSKERLQSVLQPHRPCCHHVEVLCGLHRY